MSDIVERLRHDAAGWGGATHTVAGPRVAALECEAADEIERLTEMRVAVWKLASSTLAMDMPGEVREVLAAMIQVTALDHQQHSSTTKGPK